MQDAKLCKEIEIKNLFDVNDPLWQIFSSRNIHRPKMARYDAFIVRPSLTFAKKICG